MAYIVMAYVVATDATKAGSAKVRLGMCAVPTAGVFIDLECFEYARHGPV